MNPLFRGPSASVRSKATSSTLCQKCLKRGHYSYECKATPQERPYAPRPSRTQQLLNPSLVPKLTSDVPNELLQKKGIADELLAKKEKDRGRTRRGDLDFEGNRNGGSRLARSLSASTVSTMSTSQSRDSSPRRASLEDHRHAKGRAPSPFSERAGHKRRRSPSSSASFTSSSHSYRSSVSYETRRSTAGYDRRNIRRRRGSTSPPQRGRARSRSEDRRRHRDTETDSSSTDRRGLARRRRSSSREERKMDRYHPTHERRDRGDRHSGQGQRSWRDRDDRDGRRRSASRTRQHQDRDNATGKPAAPRRTERSLSPFSKRLALTQAMNMGR